MLTSRTLLVYAQNNWPEYISTMLCPFALKAAQDSLKQLNVNFQDTNPDMRYSGVAAMTLCLRDFHSFGCLCYILDSQLQINPKGVPTWEPRARLEIYLGRSLAHAVNVALVIHLKNGLVFPQFHVVFDDNFTTVPHLQKGTVPTNWNKLVIGSQEKSTDEFFDLTKTWFQPTNDESADGIFCSRPTVNKGADQTSSPVTQVLEGDNMPTTAQAYEGDSETNSLLMPEMANLEASGIHRSNHIASQGKTSYNFFSGISRFCAFGGLLAMSLTQPTVAFSHGCTSVNAAIHQFNITN